MKLHRFIGKYDLSKENIEIIDLKTINQLSSVLRLQKDDQIVLSDGKGNSAIISLVSISKNKITGKVIKTKEKSNNNLIKRKVSLYLSILKKENFELAVQKAVECGVSKIIPIITERTIKTGLNITRLEKIILEACEQSGRNIIPTLSPILNFKDAIVKVQASDEKIIFHLTDRPYAPNQKSENISIFVGPEGGFTFKEIELSKDSGFSVVSLGPLTLRGETAAIIGTYRSVYAI